MAPGCNSTNQNVAFNPPDTLSSPFQASACTHILLPSAQAFAPCAQGNLALACSSAASLPPRLHAAAAHTASSSSSPRLHCAVLQISSFCLPSFRLSVIHPLSLWNPPFCRGFSHLKKNPVSQPCSAIRLLSLLCFVDTHPESFH